MGKQVGPIYLERTIDDVCFYKMNGEYYVRMKSSLTGKQVKTGKRFVRTMQSAGRMARGSKIAAGIYKALPVEIKEFSLYRALVGEAVLLLKAGKTDEEARLVLWERYLAEFEEGYREEDVFRHELAVAPVRSTMVRVYKSVYLIPAFAARRQRRGFRTTLLSRDAFYRHQKILNST